MSETAWFVPVKLKFVNDRIAIRRSTFDRIKAFCRNPCIAGAAAVMLTPGIVSTTSFQESITSPEQVQKVAKPIVVEQIRKTSGISESAALKIAESAVKHASEFGVSPAIILGIISTESRFIKTAISDNGAMGLMQIIPRWHVDKIRDAKKVVGTPELFNVDANIYVGVRVYASCKKQFKSTTAALNCYNGGGDPNYATKVMNAKKQFDVYI